MSKNYTTEVFWSKDDEGFVAICPDLPGCSAFGETRNDAVAELVDAIDSWIMAAKEVGNEIPEPSIRKDFESCSGKTLVRFPKELHSDLIESAKKQGVSLNAYINFLLSQKHYATDAVREFGKSLEWKAIAMNQQIVVTLGSCNTSIPEHSFSKSSEEFIPIAGFGVPQNA